MSTDIFMQEDESISLELAESKKYSVEEKLNGFHVSVHKQGTIIKIFSEQKKDITKAFPTLIKSLNSISDENFIVDGELVPYDDKGNTLGRNELMKYVGAVKSGKNPDDSNIKIHIWDLVYLNKDLSELPLSQRINYLSKLKFNDRVTEVKRNIVENEPDKLKKAIKEMSEIKGSEGAVVKDLNSPYSFGENSSWRKFRKLTQLSVEVLKAVPKKRDLYNYLVGIKADKDFLDNRYIQGNKLILGHTFNTDKVFKEGDKINILVEEVWRHETNKGIHYSIHKPRVEDKTNNIDGTDKLEDIVTSIGVSVKHNFIENIDVLSGELSELQDSGEGKEIEVLNFPDKMQNDFNNLVGKYGKYVMQVHTRGSTLHYDIRHKVNNHLQGITLFGRSIADRLPIESQRNNIRGTIKMPQPADWLTFEGVSKKGGIGATKNYPGIFTIISKGKFTIHEASDHKIVIEYKSESGKINKEIKDYAKKEGFPYPNLPDNLIDLTGKYSLHIAHIGDRHIILFDKLKS